MCRTGDREYLTLLLTLGLLVTVLPGSVQADDERLPDAGPTFDVNVDIALSSLVSLGDGHLQKMADSLHILATSEAAQSGN
jgi:hypothetical protein